MDSVLYRASAVVCSPERVVSDGAVLTAAGRIVQVESYASLRGRGERQVDLGDVLLVPGLFNCHTHLELSYLADLGQDNSFFAPGDMPAWIAELIGRRLGSRASEAQVAEAGHAALAGLCREGVVGVIDIGNEPGSVEFIDNSAVEGRFFLEGYGLAPEEAAQAETRLREHPDLSWCGHAPYSSAPELLTMIGRRADERGDIFPIHVGESALEIEFLKDGSGRFADFLSERLALVHGEAAPSLKDIFCPPRMGPVAYLDSLGLLGRRTLCVHGVHVEAREIAALARWGASVCLCPLSNAYLGVGTAPVADYLAAGVNLVLGTDSLVSNHTLSIWEEMAFLAESCPEVAPEAIWAMATENGARFMGLSCSYGTIAPGKSANMVAVSGIDIQEDGIIASLVRGGRPPKIELISGS